MVGANDMEGAALGCALLDGWIDRVGILDRDGGLEAVGPTVALLAMLGAKLDDGSIETEGELLLVGERVPSKLGELLALGSLEGIDEG